MKTRITVVAIIAVVAFAFAFSASSEELDAIDVSTFDDLKASLEAEGSTIVVLTSDVVADSQINILGNKTLTSNNGSAITRSTGYNHGTILYVGEDSSLTISGSVVLNGNSNWITNDQSDSFIKSRGVLTFQDDVSMKNCHYGVPSSAWGTTPPGGSAVSNYGSMVISGGSFTGNSGGDGVVYTSKATLTITGGSINSNSSRALVIEDASKFQMSGGTISGNNGGITASGEAFTWTELNISGGSISGNNSLGNRGAGIYLDHMAKLNLSGGTIENNTLAHSTTGSRGGGIFVGQKSTANLTGGVISGNDATYGGGICTSGDMTIDGAVIKNNSIDGIYIDQATVTMTGGTIESNQVYLFAGVFKMTGGSVVKTSNAVQAPNSTWGGGFQFGGSAKFDSDSSVSMMITLVEGETQVISSHSITIVPNTYVEGAQWVSGSPTGLVSLNHEKIDVYPYQGEKWVVDENGCLVNTHQAAGTPGDGGSSGGISTTLIIALAVILLIVATALIVRSRIKKVV